MLIEKWKANLDNESISEIMLTVDSRLEQYNVDSHEKVHISLMVKEALIAYLYDAEKYKEFEIILLHGKRKAIVCLRVAGPAKNHLLEKEDEDEYIVHYLSSISAKIDEAIRYSYRLGRNILIYRAHIEKKKPNIAVSSVLICAIVGIVLGLISRFLPVEWKDFLMNDFASPILKVILGMLSGIMGPVVFFSVITSLIRFNDISTLNGIGRKIIRRMVMITLVAILIPMLLYMVFSIKDLVLFSSVNASDLITMLLEIFPLNIFRPFVDNNIIQIVILSGFIGVIMVMTGSSSSSVADFVIDLSNISMNLMKALTKLTPILILLSAYKMAVSIEIQNILPVVSILIAIYVSGALVLLFFLLLYKVRTKGSIIDLLKNGRYYGGKAFVVASGSAVMNDLFELSQTMGMEQRFAKLYISMSVALSSAGNTIFLVCSAFFFAHTTGASISLTWLITLVLLCFELTIATPGGNGGVLVTVTVLLGQLGLSQENIGLLAIAQLLCANYIAAVGAMVRFITLVEANEKVAKEELL